MIDLGDKLGITVTAKLVESPSQAARLRAFGCKAAQGWHFAKALPVDFSESRSRGCRSMATACFTKP